MTDAERLTLLETLLGKGQNPDALAFCLSDCERLILDYCSLDALPEELESLLARMAADRFRMSAFGQAEAACGPVSSLSEGSKSVSFGGAAAAAVDQSGLLGSYARQLARYRRLRW